MLKQETCRTFAQVTLGRPCGVQWGAGLAVPLPSGTWPLSGGRGGWGTVRDGCSCSHFPEAKQSGTLRSPLSLLSRKSRNVSGLEPLFCDSGLG